MVVVVLRGIYNNIVAIWFCMLVLLLSLVGCFAVCSLFACLFWIGC